MAITLQGASAATLTISFGSATFFITCSGTNSILLMGNVTGVSTATYGGLPMTNIGQFFYLFNPPLGSNTMVVTGGDGIHCFVFAEYNDVGAIGANNISSANTFPAFTIPGVSTTVSTTTANSMLVGLGFGLFGSPSGGPGFTAVAGTTILANSIQIVFYNYTALAMLENGIIASPGSNTVNVDFTFNAQISYGQALELIEGVYSPSQFFPFLHN